MSLPENNDEQKFLSDLSDWLDDQVLLMKKAMKFAEAENEHDAAVRYESRLEAYEFLVAKMENYKKHKPFDALPEGLGELREY